MDTIIVDNSSSSPYHTKKRKRYHAQHHRNYQACNLCRMRKVRCDLGSLDNPQAPCAKCRREQKECVFESQPPVRRKRSLRPEDSSASPPHLTQPDDVADTEHNVRGRSITAGESGCLFGPQANELPEARLPNGTSEQNKTPPATGSLRASGHNSHAAPDGTSTSPRSRLPLNSSLVDAVVRTDTDALHLLFSTALQQQDSQDQAAGGVTRTGNIAGLAEEDRVPRSEAFGRTTTTSANRVAERGSNAQRAPASVSRSALSPISAEVAAVWSQFGPCQQRCVTSAEVIAYLGYFFSVLNRQMPILHDTFHDPATHSTLIAEDPLLCCTILTIASRYLDLSGQMGHSRGYLLHETFFKFVKETLQQLFWGRLFGDESGTTVVGAIESLLLLTQWHPRRIHVSEAFSPLANSHLDTSYPSSADRTHDPVMTEAMTSAFRYDSMCWKLAGMAITLANEHGLFDFQQTAQNTTGLCFRGDLRVPHAKKMLYIYSTGLATRLRRVNPLAGISVSSLKRHQPSHLPEKQSEWHRAMNGWIELIDLSSMASDLLYASPQSTRDLICQGKYISVLRRFELFLSQWWENYQNVDVPHAFKCNYEIEYHYLRIHVYSITLQAIVERSTQFALGGSSLNLLNGASHSQTSEEYELLKEVVSSCCRVFELIIELHAGSSLTGVTVPLLLRIVTVSMFGLKVLGLNLKEELNLTEEDYLITLLDRLVVVLQESAIDDLHLSNHYAQLLERLLKKTKDRELHSGGPRHHHPEGSMPRVAQQDGHRQGSGNILAFDDDFTEMNVAAADWSEWLAFQSDPTFAAFYANNNLDGNNTSRDDGYTQDHYFP